MNRHHVSLRLPAPRTTGSIGPDQVKAFAAASGDNNPIHVSEDAARRAGLAGPPLHGMFIAARFETFLESIPEAQLADLQVRFVRPAPVGSSLVISARSLAETDTSLHLRLLAKSPEGTLFAVGEARLSLG